MEKSNIQDYYEDSVMPMRLQMVTESVYDGGYGLGQ